MTQMQHDVINAYRWRSRQTFGERGVIIIHSTNIFRVIMQDNEHAFINQNKDGLPRIDLSLRIPKNAGC